MPITLGAIELTNPKKILKSWLENFINVMESDWLLQNDKKDEWLC